MRQEMRRCDLALFDRKVGRVLLSRFSRYETGIVCSVFAQPRHRVSEFELEANSFITNLNLTRGVHGPTLGLASIFRVAGG